MTQSNHPADPGHTARIEYLIPRELPEPSDANQSMGDWPPGIAEEARRRGSWPIIKIIWPEDNEIIASAHAAKVALKVANDNVTKDPLVSALAKQVASALPSPTQVAPLPSLPFLMRLPDYAQRCGYSVSFIKRLISRGLPTKGKKKAKRVHVVRADRWLEENLDLLDVTDSQEVQGVAKANAHRGAGK